jgi:predicted ATP-grasp superfamily ATP-dependent carboligase
VFNFVSEILNLKITVNDLKERVHTLEREVEKLSAKFEEMKLMNNVQEVKQVSW